MRETDTECPEDGCERTLRVRDHGRPSEGLRDPAEIEQCAVRKKSDGERCPHDAYEGEHTCGVHEGADTDRYVHVAWRIGERTEPAEPHGEELECPVHGLSPPEREGFPEHVRQQALEV